MEELKPRLANSAPLTPLGYLERAATVYANCTSIIYNHTTYTWSQTHLRCLRVASSISSFGINRHDVVSVLAPNIPAMYELHFAVPMAGAVLNTLNLRLDHRTISVLLRHSESKLVFVDKLSKSLIQDAISLFQPGTPIPRLVLIDGDDGDDDRTEAALPSTLSSSSPAVEFVCRYEDMVVNGDPEFQWVQPLTGWDPLVLNYTSGTTSSPKGVVHCHRGVFISTLDSLVDWSMPKRPVFLWTLPMFHGNGWTFPWGMAAVGGTNICLRKFDAPLIYRLIKAHKVTHLCGAPVVLNMLANSPAAEPLNHRVFLDVAGAPPPPTLLLRMESLGFEVTHGYGLTEAGGLVATCEWKPEWDLLPASERARLKSRQGVRTVARSRVDVVDPETGRSVERDGVTMGEVVVKGGCVMLGYLKDPAGTAKCLKEDGWFYTGDVAVVHPDGYLEIKDRSKDVIISGGENLSSVEVEWVLYTHPAINEAAVVARPDDYWGETPCAFVSLKEGIGGSKPSEKEVIEYCRARLPHFMVPKTVVFKDELPKSGTGKIQKFVLREIAKGMGSVGASRTRPQSRL
ncbi:2-methylpropanoate--CoA ligase CCL4 [Ziziphus jujuba]|uniref:2-methylpropanoate--CoA ligase CCL4 n=1 Tax=Ziziphus jujuba TaxID=326968 RepID=A0A6P4AB11_ZIZJJ|nr:2-methylpropanoate--CoA ligase CCL4 [Ziziphus jujuba]